MFTLSDSFFGAALGFDSIDPLLRCGTQRRADVAKGERKIRLSPSNDMIEELHPAGPATRQRRRLWTLCRPTPAVCGVRASPGTCFHRRFSEVRRYCRRQPDTR